MVCDCDFSSIVMLKGREGLTSSMDIASSSSASQSEGAMDGLKPGSGDGVRR